MLTTTTRMLAAAQAGGYAVGAFNIENMEMALAVVRAAEACAAPVILQTTPGTLRYGGIPVYAAMVRAIAEGAKIPIALHLDHGDAFARAAEAFRFGYTSLMIDGSKLPFAENVALTQQVVRMAHAAGIPVEAELGTVGGKEDDTIASGTAYTDPAEAALFAAQTACDSLAVGIGTAHGFYQGIPVLDKARLTAIREKVAIPLVLHGASGLTDAEVRDCIARGICKVNFATELRAAFTDAVRAVLREKPDALDPKAPGQAGMAAVAALVQARIAVCGCEGKA
ncbi:MAG: class II fructose-bisphosphate aldolase [Oscillospiraceae bacterium]|jgi:tagatose 1,6-diphosphate aldolase GatY/KbaY|nr:class II fructose-bisphosphate aldolase [Oscillospiraceae bacterium]